MEMFKEFIICPKCQGVQFTMDWNKEKDVIERKCIRCGWSQDQLPLDRKEVTSE